MTPFAFWIFATWCTLIVLFFQHALGHVARFQMAKARAAHQRRRPRAKRQKVEESTSKVLRYETNVLKLIYLWPCNINCRNNTNTSNNGEIRIDRTLALYEKDILYWNVCFTPCAEFRNCGHLRVSYNLQQDEMMPLHMRQSLTENIFQTEIQTEIASFG